MKLTRNFKKSEFSYSETAARQGTDNSIPNEFMPNIIRVANCLQALRDRIWATFNDERPITVTSGYRSPELNKATNGSKNSAHLKGLAADIRVIRMAPMEVCEFIRDHMSDFPIDQVIEEFDSWVHIALAEEGKKPRRQFLKARTEKQGNGKSKTVYTPLFPEQEAA